MDSSIPTLKKLTLDTIRKLPEPLKKELIEGGVVDDLYVSIHHDGTYYYIKYVPFLHKFYLTGTGRFGGHGILIGNIESLASFFTHKTRSRHTKIHIFGSETSILDEDLYNTLVFIKDAEIIV